MLAREILHGPRTFAMSTCQLSTLRFVIQEASTIHRMQPHYITGFRLGFSGFHDDRSGSRGLGKDLGWVEGFLSAPV